MSINKAIFLLLLMPLLSLASCKDKGEFAFKNFDMDSYRKMPEGMEIAADAKVDWLFNLSAASGKVYGVIILKKELVWVEVKKDVQRAQKGSPYLYGCIADFDPGEYKIVISNDNTLVAEKGFIIYDPALPENEIDEK